MLHKRIIPVLLLCDQGVIKTRQFQNRQYIGDPINIVKIFNEKEVDEIVILDIDATKKCLPPDTNRLKSITSEALMPVTYGGGIKTSHHVEQCLKNGAEKVMINHAFYEKEADIAAMIQTFGAQSIVTCIDVAKVKETYKVYDYKNQKTFIDFIDYCRQIQKVGFGEIIIQHRDRDGGLEGYDKQLIALARQHVDAPLIMLGGANSYHDLKEALHICDAAAAGALFCLFGKHRAVLIQYPTPQEKEEIIV